MGKLCSSYTLKLMPLPMKHRHRTRHGHVGTCNIQNIECSTGIVSVSDTHTDACQTPDTARGWGVRAS